MLILLILFWLIWYANFNPCLPRVLRVHNILHSVGRRKAMVRGPVWRFGIAPHICISKSSYVTFWPFSLPQHEMSLIAIYSNIIVFLCHKGSHISIFNENQKYILRNNFQVIWISLKVTKCFFQDFMLKKK